MTDTQIVPEPAEDQGSREFQDVVTEEFRNAPPFITRHSDPPRPSQPLQRSSESMSREDQPSGRQAQSESGSGAEKSKQAAPSGRYTYSAEADTFTGEDGQQYQYVPGKGLILVGR